MKTSILSPDSNSAVARAEADQKRLAELELSLATRTKPVKVWLGTVSQQEIDKYFNGFDFHLTSGRTLLHENIAGTRGLYSAGPTIIEGEKYYADASEDIYFNNVNKDYKSVKDISGDPSVPPALKLAIIEEYKGVFPELSRKS